MACKKKLYAAGPRPPQPVATHRTRATVRHVNAEPLALERDVRQLLCDKVCATHVGLWLLVPEHLRLGTFDLLRAWTGQDATRVEPRLALQLVHEAALCLTNVRQRRCLSQKGFELANGLPFIAADQPIHDLLDARGIPETQNLQIALGMIRRSLGDYPGRLLAIDPHRMRSYSKRQMRRRKEKDRGPAVKSAQIFFCLDVDSGQPLGFTIGAPARSAPQATPDLLELAKAVLQPRQRPLVLLDSEHYSADLFDHVRRQTPFDLLAPLPQSKHLARRLAQLPPEQFTRRWAGYATAVLPYTFSGHDETYCLFAQRCGERPEDYRFKSFLATRPDDPVQALTEQYPKRWHLEEFFNANQALGWNRAGTLNLHIRYGQMTMALLAQAAIHQLRRRLPAPWNNAEAACLARDLFTAIDGDIRVHDDTILVTCYNAPPALRQHYEHLPRILQSQHIDPRIPWLCNFKLDFRFT